MQPQTLTDPNFLDALKLGIEEQLKEAVIGNIVDDFVKDVTEKIERVAREEVSKYILTNITAFKDMARFGTEVHAQVHYYKEGVKDEES